MTLAPLSEPWSVLSQPIYSLRPANVVIQSTNAWYIIPIEALGDEAHNISLSPHNSLSKYAEYQEAWYLLRGEEKKPD